MTTENRTREPETPEADHEAVLKSPTTKMPFKMRQSSFHD